MPRRGLYKGMSSFEFQARKTFSLQDVELVKMDLLNHIHTKRGSRVMMPNFGTQIPEMAFEPLDEETVDIIREELLTVFEFDPRVDLLDLDVQPDYERNQITAAARVFYVELNLVDNIELHITFEGR